MDILSLLHYGFIQRGLIAGVCIAILAPTVGMFVVSKRYAMISDTLAHVALAALAISVLLPFAPLPIVALCTVASSISIEYIRERGIFSGEQVLSLFLSGSLSIAIIIMSVTKSSGIQSVLFGSLSTVSTADLWTIIAATILILALIVVFFPQLLSTVFHEELAQIRGVHTRIVQYGIVICAALTITLSLRIVGGLLVGALMVVPVLAAMQLRKSFGTTTIAACVIALVAMLAGFALSIQWDVPSGATIVLSAVVCFILTSLYRYVRN